MGGDWKAKVETERQAGRLAQGSGPGELAPGFVWDLLKQQKHDCSNVSIGQGRGVTGKEKMQLGKNETTIFTCPAQHSLGSSFLNVPSPSPTEKTHTRGA